MKCIHFDEDYCKVYYDYSFDNIFKLISIVEGKPTREAKLRRLNGTEAGKIPVYGTLEEFENKARCATNSLNTEAYADDCFAVAIRRLNKGERGWYHEVSFVTEEIVEDAAKSLAKAAIENGENPQMIIWRMRTRNFIETSAKEVSEKKLSQIYDEMGDKEMHRHCRYVRPR